MIPILLASIFHFPAFCLTIFKACKASCNGPIDLSSIIASLGSRYLSTKAVTPSFVKAQATSLPSRFVSKPPYPPPGQIMIAEPLDKFFKGRKMVKVGIETFLVTVSTKAFAVFCSSFILIFEFGILPGYRGMVCWALEIFTKKIKKIRTLLLIIKPIIKTYT